MDERNRLFQEFLSFETKYDVYSFRIESQPVWELIRRTLYKRLLRNNLDVEQAHDRPEQNKLESGYKLLRNLFIKNPFTSPQTDLLFWGHHRRKLLDDGYWWDIYTDPILNELDQDYVNLERPFMNRHLTPAKTASIRYLDLIYYSGGIRRYIQSKKFELTADELSQVEYIEDGWNKRFSQDIDLTYLVEKYLLSYFTAKPLYKWILKRVQPNIAVIVVSYGKEAFIDACKEMGVPVIELQHGVIHEHHLGYHFPGDRMKFSFPDYLLVWGDFWKQNVVFPIPEERVITTGFPYLEQRQTRYSSNSQHNQIVFISQGTVGKELSKFALEVASHPKIDHEVVYKLHPGEYKRWRNEYTWLVDADLKVVDSSDPPLYKLFAESSAQIGVGSTAIYEGLCFDLETYVCDLPGSSVLEPLVDEGAAKLISSVDELASSLGTRELSFDREYYFAPNATENTCQALQKLANEGSTRSTASSRLN